MQADEVAEVGQREVDQPHGTGILARGRGDGSSVCMNETVQSSGFSAAKMKHSCP